MVVNRFSFHLLDKSFDREPFDCGVAPLNAFLKSRARQSQNKGFNRTYVAIAENDPRKTIVGYYAVSMGQIELNSLPDESRKSLPRHPIPVGRIGRLAIDKSMQGKGLGREVLVDALKRVRDASKIVGAFAVIVDAKNESAKRFYQKYGFLPLADDPMTLFLAIGSIP